jgi:hypothetical protein
MRSSGGSGVTSFKNWVMSGITSPIKAMSAGLGAIGGLSPGIAVVSIRLPSWVGKRGRMEPFTLTIWLWMGARFEQTQIENLGRGECVERLMTIRGDRPRAIAPEPTDASCLKSGNTSRALTARAANCCRTEEGLDSGHDESPSPHPDVVRAAANHDTSVGAVLAALHFRLRR